MKARARKNRLLRRLDPKFINLGQFLFEDRNPWAIGSVVDWSRLTLEQRLPWEREALKPEAPEIPLEHLCFEPSGPARP